MRKLNYKLQLQQSLCFSFVLCLAAINLFAFMLACAGAQKSSDMHHGWARYFLFRTLHVSIPYRQIVLCSEVHQHPPDLSLRSQHLREFVLQKRGAL